MTPWDEYLKAQSEEYQQIKAEIEKAPINQHLRTLSETYVREGKEATILQLNKIARENKLKTAEVVILTGRLHRALIDNGVVIRR